MRFFHKQNRLHMDSRSNSGYSFRAFASSCVGRDEWINFLVAHWRKSRWESNQHIDEFLGRAASLAAEQKKMEKRGGDGRGAEAEGGQCSQGEADTKDWEMNDNEEEALDSNFV